MEVQLESIPFDIDFHPSSNLVVTGLINGKVYLYKYQDEAEPQMSWKIRAHKESCRAVRFINGGQAILTASPDHSMLAVDVETGAAVARLKKAHDAAICRVVNLTETTIASGDDEGCIKVWDTRQRSCCNSFDAHEDYIADLTFVSDSMQLLGASGDGTLSVCSLRKDMVQSKSEYSEDELLSVVRMKNGRKVICGTQTGALLLYSWGHFEDCSDRFLEHPMPVNALLKVDEDTLISGSEDGVIRLAGILPNRIIQPIAEHSGDSVERLALSHDRKHLGSISLDETLKIWDFEELVICNPSAQTIQAVEPDSEDDEMDLDVNPGETARGSKRKRVRGGKSSKSSAASFFADL